MPRKTTSYFAGLLVLCAAILTILILLAGEAQAGGRPSLEIPRNPVNKSPGILTSYKVTVENRGDADNFTISLSYDNPNGSWTVYASTSKLWISADNTKSFYLYVKPHNNDTMPLADTSLQVTVTVTAESAPDSDSGIVTTTCTALYDLDIEIVGNSSAEVEPGEEKVFQLNVTNTGNADIKLDNDIVFPPPDMVAQVITGITIKPGENATVNVTIYVDDDAEQGLFTIQCEISTQEDSDVKRTISFSINVLAKPEFEADSKGNSSKETEPNRGVKYSMTIENTGNVQDSYALELDLSTVPLGWSATLHVSKVYTIDPGVVSTQDNFLTIKPPSDHELAAHGSMASVKINISSNYAKDQGEDLLATLRFVCEVDQVYSLYLEALTSTVNGDLYDVLEVTLHLENTGNGKDRVALSLDGDAASWGYLDMSTVTLGRTGSSEEQSNASLTLTIDIPGNAQYKEEGHTLSVWARSEDPSGFMKRQVVIIVHVAKFHDISLSLDGAASREVLPKGRLDFSLTLTNTGNSLDSFSSSIISLNRVDGVAADSWATLANVSDLAGNWTTKDLDLEVNVPGNVPKGFYDLRVFMNSTGDPSASSSVDVRVKVKQVYKAALSCSLDKLEVVPGDRVNFQLVLKNIGNGGDSFLVSAVGLPTPLSATVTPSLTPTISRNGELQLNVSISVKERTDKRDFGFNLSVSSTGNETLSWKRELTVSVLPYYRFEFQIAQGGNSILHAAPSSLETRTAVFSLSLENTGTGNDTISFEVDNSQVPEDENWLQDITDVTLDPGEEKQVNFTVIVDSGAAVRKTGISFILSAFSSGNRTITQDLNVKLIVDQVSDLNLVARSTREFADPGSTIFFNIEITNTGNGKDIFSTEVLGVDPDLAVGYSPGSVDLESGESGNVTITVQVEEGAPNQDLNFSMVVFSQRDDSVKQSQSFTVKVDPSYDLSFSIYGDSGKRVDPGETANFQFRVVNTGTAVDNFKFQMADSGIPGNEYWLISLSDVSNVSLEVGESKLVSLNITSDDDAVKQSLGILFTVTARSQENTSIQRQVTVKVMVNQRFSLLLSSQQQREETLPGERVDFSLRLKNTGTGNDTFFFETEGNVPANLTTIFQPASLELEAGQSQSILVKATVLEGSWPENLDVRVRAYSDGDNGMEKFYTFTVKVLEYHEFQFLMQGANEKTTNPTKEAVYHLFLENTGTADDGILLEVDTSQVPEGEDWLFIYPEELFLRAGATKHFKLKVTPAKNAVPQQHGLEFVLKAESRDGPPLPDLLKEQALTLKVNQSYDVAFEKSTFYMNVDPGDEARVMVYLVNTGTGMDSFELNIYDPDNTHWGIAHDYSPEDVPAGDRLYFNVTLDVDWDAYYGEPVNFKLSASSLGNRENGDGSSVKAECLFNITVNPRYGVDFDEYYLTEIATPSHGNFDTVEFTFNIINTGTVTDDFRVELNTALTSADVFSWGLITQGSMLNGLSSGENGIVRFQVEVPDFASDHHATPGDKDFWLEVYSKTARDNEREIQNVTTDLFRGTVNIEEYYHVQVDNLDTSIPKLLPGENASFRIKVENLGNKVDTISLIGDGDTPTNGRYSSWQSFVPSVVTLDPDTHTTVNMTITVDPVGENEADDYDFYYHGKSQGKFSVESPRRSNAIILQEVLDLHLEINNDFLQVRPGETTSFPIQLTNEGNSRQRITLLNPDLIPPGWEVYWATSAGSTVPIEDTGLIEVADTETRYLKITPLEDHSRSMAGLYKFPFLVRISKGEENVTAAGIVTVMVEAVEGLTLEEKLDSLGLKPGEMGLYRASLVNTGNVWDNFSYDLVDPGSLGWLTLNGSRLPQQGPNNASGFNSSTGLISLAPLEEIDVLLELRIPAFTQEDARATAGLYFQFSLELISRGNIARSETVFLSGQVQEQGDVVLRYGNTYQDVLIEKQEDIETEFYFQVENLGNRNGSFFFQAAPGELEGPKKNWDLSFRTSQGPIPRSGFNLSSLMEKDIFLSLSIDPTTPEGTYDLEIEVISLEDSAARDHLTFTINCAEANYGASLRSVNDKNQWNQSTNPADMPRDGMEYRFIVKNEGEVPDSFLLQRETNVGSGTYKDWEIVFAGFFEDGPTLFVPSEVPSWTGGEYLDVGEEIEITLFVKPPEDAEASGTDLDRYGDLEISVHSESDPKESESIFFRLIIIRPDLRLGSEDIVIHANENTKIGDAVAVEITIHNDGHAKSGKFAFWLYRSREDSSTGLSGVVGMEGLLAHERVLESIDPLSSYTVELDFELEWGKHELYCYVDKPIWNGPDKTDDQEEGDVIESKENNNDARATVPELDFIDQRPWMEVLDVKWDRLPEKGRTTIVTVTINNNESHPGCASYGEAPDDTQMYIRCKADNQFFEPQNPDGSAGMGQLVTVTLLPNDDLDIRFSWPVEEKPGDNVTLLIYIDYSQNKNPLRVYIVEIPLFDEEGKPISVSQDSGAKDENTLTESLGPLPFHAYLALLIMAGLAMVLYWKGTLRLFPGMRPHQEDETPTIISDPEDRQRELPSTGEGSGKQGGDPGANKEFNARFMPPRDYYVSGTTPDLTTRTETGKMEETTIPQKYEQTPTEPWLCPVCQSKVDSEFSFCTTCLFERE